MKKMADYLVFVDFDGVLTSTRVHMAQPEDSYPLWSTFDPIVMEFFNKIHNRYDVEFVWTTTWRNNLEDAGLLTHVLYSMWYNAGFRGHFADPWRVNPEKRRDGLVNTAARAEEIKDYLENYAPDCKDYLIFDDSDYNFDKVLGKKRLVLTDPHNGMLYKHMAKALSIMGEWDRK
jgi:hypothetical protein